VLLALDTATATTINNHLEATMKERIVSALRSTDKWLNGWLKSFDDVRSGKPLDKDMQDFDTLITFVTNVGNLMVTFDTKYGTDFTKTDEWVNYMGAWNHLKAILVNTMNGKPNTSFKPGMIEYAGFKEVLRTLNVFRTKYAIKDKK
jgi:hypothetical protein